MFLFLYLFLGNSIEVLKNNLSQLYEMSVESQAQKLADGK